MQRELIAYFIMCSLWLLNIGLWNISCNNFKRILHGNQLSKSFGTIINLYLNLDILN